MRVVSRSASQLIVGPAVVVAVLVAIGLSFADRTSYATDEHAITFRAWIDGSDYVHIQGNEIWYEHRNFQYQGLWKAQGGEACPADMSPYVWPVGDPHRETLINGDPWVALWPDDCGYDDPGQVSLNTYTKAALPQQLCADSASLTSTSIGDLGRQDADQSSISIVQQPSAANDYTTIVLLDDDPGFFAAYLEFTLSLAECKPTTTPTVTDIPMPTATSPAAVGGVSVDVPIAPADDGPGFGLPLALAAASAAALTLASAAWYVRRRWAP